MGLLDIFTTKDEGTPSPHPSTDLSSWEKFKLFFTEFGSNYDEGKKIIANGGGGALGDVYRAGQGVVNTGTTFVKDTTGGIGSLAQNLSWIVPLVLISGIFLFFYFGSKK